MNTAPIIGDTIRTKKGVVARIESAVTTYRLEDGTVCSDKDITSIISRDGDFNLVGELCRRVGADLDTIRSASHKRSIVTRRHAIMYYIATHYGWTRLRTGYAMNRNHTSVTWGVAHVAGMLDIGDDVFQDTIAALEGKKNILGLWNE